jgi:uroporphyrin-III C-methyltransferase/precorrin-2 dehydrogenase/sirohydrochlorin ferrochelatase
MKAFPMFIKTTDRRVIIVGGGEQAAQKARLMMKTDAQIIFAALELDPEIEALVETGQAAWYNGPLTGRFFLGAAMVFVATGCFAIDVSAHAIAKSAHCAVNVVDQPDLCDITTPSLVDRDPVVVAIGTEGTAPVLARQIKTRIEQTLPQNLGGLAALSGRLRRSVAKHVERSKRRAFWAWVFSGKPRELWDRGAEAHAASAIKDAILNQASVPGAGGGSLSVLDTGEGDPEMQTLRAVKRLQAADIIFYDRPSDVAILELARRDAERVHLGDVEGQDHRTLAWLWNRMRIEATQGKSVVFLTKRFSACDKAMMHWHQDARAADIVFEHVPSVVSRVLKTSQVSGEQWVRKNLAN